MALWARAGASKSAFAAGESAVDNPVGELQGGVIEAELLSLGGHGVLSKIQGNAGKGVLQEFSRAKAKVALSLV